MRKLILLPFVLGLALAAVGKPAAQGKRAPDRCFRNTDLAFVFVFQEVPTLTAGRTIPLRGLFFGDPFGSFPLDGSAVVSADGSVRLGAVVHYSHTFMIKGQTTDGSLVGQLGFDWNGDFVSDYQLPLQPVECSTLSIP